MSQILPFPSAAAKKAVILARVSSKEQEEGYSIDAQKHRLQLYCTRRNLEVIRVFEITESSTTGDRGQFLEMVNYAKTQKECIAIVADKVDRVQRSFREFPLLDDLIKAGKIELHFNTENQIIHQKSVSQEHMIWSFHIMLAKAYTDSQRDHVRRSQEHKIRLGEYSSMAPIGYKNIRDDKGRSDIILDDDRAPLVRRLFVEYAEGIYTVPEMTQKAKEWGLRNKAGNEGALSKGNVWHILNNKFYYGYMTVKGQLYPHRYEPLIDKKLYDACQDVMHSWKKKPFKWGEKDFMFRGLIKCATTGATVSGLEKKRTRNGTARKWMYWRCNSPENPAKTIYVRQEDILQQMDAALARLQMPGDLIAAMVSHIRATEGTEREFIDRQADELTKEHKILQKRLDKVMDLHMDGLVDRGEFERRRKEFRDRQVEIEQQLGATRAGDDGFKDAMLFMLDSLKNIRELFAGSQNDEKRALVGQVFENLELKGATLCYSFKTPFSWFADLAKSEEWCPRVDALRTSPAARVLIIDFASRRRLAA